MTWIVVAVQSSTSPHDPFVQTPTASLPAPEHRPQCSQHMNIISCDSQRQGHSGLHSQTGTRCALMAPTLSRYIPQLPRRNKPLMTGSVDLPGEDKHISARWLSAMSAKLTVRPAGICPAVFSSLIYKYFKCPLGHKKHLVRHLNQRGWAIRT